jgi:hypothetical protein
VHPPGYGILYVRALSIYNRNIISRIRSGYASWLVCWFCCRPVGRCLSRPHSGLSSYLKDSGLLMELSSQTILKWQIVASNQAANFNTWGINHTRKRSRQHAIPTLMIPTWTSSLPTVTVVAQVEPSRIHHYCKHVGQCLYCTRHILVSVDDNMFITTNYVNNLRHLDYINQEHEQINDLLQE